VSSDRAARLSIPATIAAVSLASGISASQLSEAERGLRTLTPEQREALRAALGKLREETDAP
jgi:hypothetical protein